MPFFSLPTGGSSPVLVTNGPPTGSLGNPGDLAIDAANKLLYGPKDAVTGWPTGIDLSQGPTGSTGPTAPASTIAIGSVTTGPTASVSVTGTAPSQTLSFVLPFATGPTGGYAFAATGPTAPAGANLTLAGAVWLDDSTGRYYVRYETNWVEIGVQGERGPTGSAGAASTVTGPTAPASTLTVGSVTTGTNASVTITGTAPSQTISFVIPAITGPAGGPTGPSGPSGPAGSFGESQSINAQVTGYTLVLSDAGKLVTFNTTGSVNVVVPSASGVAFATGTHIDIARLNTGTVAVTGATGVTVNGTPGKSLRAQYSAASVILYADNTWLVVGDLSS
jgi:hypothetical protein